MMSPILVAAFLVPIVLLVVALLLMRENEEAQQLERLRRTAARAQLQQDLLVPAPLQCEDLVTREERLRNHPQYVRARVQ